MQTNQLSRCVSCLGYFYDGTAHTCVANNQGYTIPMPVPTGWRCPQCQRIHAPSVLSCASCEPPPRGGMLTGGTPGLGTITSTWVAK